MPSIHPNYEYDIFISYRHNDNLPDRQAGQDGWVTRFVEALSKELKATLKNEVSIYFDENPHDGLLESHQVDASLAKKLKCLVFIPIVSQTYCDETSFAWEHEFMPFNRMAKEDDLGMNITLSNGNVVSRVLPVKIHDLDAEDQHMLEGVLDGPLRSIDFIYTEPGVNRPLAQTDNDTKNLNNTLYKNQINKVANALKDIGTSILRSEEIDAYDLPQVGNIDFKTRSTMQSKRSSMKKLLIPVLLLVVFSLAFFFLKPILFKADEVKNIAEVGLAIMPLKNISNNPNIVNLRFALKDQTQNKLSLSKKFAFLSSHMATAVYKDRDISPQEVGEELDVDYVLAGFFDLVGDRLKVNVELVDARTGSSVWSDSYDKLFNEQNINPMQAEIAQKVLAFFNESDEKIVADKQNINFESYDYYIKGLEWMQKGYELETRLKAINEFEQAINLDSSHTQSWIELIECKSNLIFNEDVEKNEYLPEIESYLDFLSKNHPEWASELAQGIYQYHAISNYNEGLKHFVKVVEQYPDNEMANYLTAAIYKRKLKNSDAYNIMLKLISSDPQNSLYWEEISLLFQINGDYKRAIQARSRAIELGHEHDSTYYSGLLSRIWHYRASIPLDGIPVQYRTSNNKRVLLAKIYNTNNPRTIIEQLKDIPLDKTPGSNNYTIVEHYLDLAVNYYTLSLDDSSRYYANLCITANEEQEEKEWIWVSQAYSILGEQEKSDDFRERFFNYDSESLIDQVELTIFDISNLVLNKKYAEATELLIELNRDFPEYGYYFTLTSFEYNRAKKEYPPFAEAVANLKMPPPLVEDNQLERLKY